MAAIEGGLRRYGGPAISLHWLIACLVFTGFGLGVFMHELPLSPQKLSYYSWHKWIGVTVFLLAVARAAWRITHPAPKLHESTPAWQRLAAQGTHLALYGLMFAIPLSGWLHSSAAGYQTVYLGILPLPDLLSKNPPLSEQLGEVHELLNYALFFLLLLHAAAALQHHYLRRDDVLLRMLPRAPAKLWSGLATLFAVGGFATIIALASGEEAGEHVAAGGAQESQARAAAARASNRVSSEIVAEFKQMGVAVQGRFNGVRADLAFDAGDLAAARASVEVDTASFDIGAQEYNEEVRKPEWFDSAAHPLASFVSTGIRALGGDRYEASGRLTIKGNTQDISVPLTIAPGDDGATVYSGSFTVSRAAFGIGDASWNDVLEDAVVIHFRFVTSPSIPGAPA